MKKACEGATSPISPPNPLYGGYLFSMWGWTADEIKHDKFKLDQFWAFGAPDRQK